MTTLGCCDTIANYTCALRAIMKSISDSCQEGLVAQTAFMHVPACWSRAHAIVGIRQCLRHLNADVHCISCCVKQEIDLARPSFVNPQGIAFP